MYEEIDTDIINAVEEDDELTSVDDTDIDANDVEVIELDQLLDEVNSFALDNGILPVTAGELADIIDIATSVIDGEEIPIDLPERYEMSISSSDDCDLITNTNNDGYEVTPTSCCGNCQSCCTSCNISTDVTEEDNIEEEPDQNEFDAQEQEGSSTDDDTGDENV